MSDLNPSSAPDQFVWATGIEDTFVPQARRGHRALDEYELMGHYEHWREDLALTRELGVQAIRWGIPWYRVQPTPDQYDWTWTDQVIPYLVEELGVTPIIDLMHYGCPFWLTDEFASDAYPSAVASYAAAVAERYGHLVRWYTPLNEPLVNAQMCGRRGVWPPYLRGDAGYVRIMMQLAKGIIATVEAIRSVQPDSRMVHVEATGIPRSSREDLLPLVQDQTYQNYLCYDLITGRVTPNHSLYVWLVRAGASPDELHALADRALTLDFMGLNFYPQWSTQEYYVDPRGRMGTRAVEKDGSGFEQLIRDYYQRYQVPIMVTETSAVGSDALRLQWLEDSLRAIRELRASEVPVLGYTWFPLFTMIDWRYRFGRKPIEDYYLELGLYRLRDGNHSRRWEATPLVSAFRNAVNNAIQSIGFLKGDRR